MTLRIYKWAQVPLAARVTAIVGATFLSCVVMLGLVVQNSISRHFSDGDADELRVVAASIKNVLESDHLEMYGEDMQRKLENAVSGHHGIYYAVFDGKGNEIYSTPGPELSHLITRIAPVEKVKSDNLYRWSEGDSTYRGAILLVQSGIAGSPQENTVIVAASMNFHLHFMEDFERKLWSILVCSSLIILLSAWLAVHIAHRPLHRISEKIGNITTEKLNMRLNAEQVPVDLLELVSSFNEMMERMDEVFTRLSNFSADIAHELRTPITNLVMQTQVSLSKERDSEEYREILYSNLEEYERMARMINDMLWLAQADNGIIRPSFQTLDLAVEVRELFDYLGAWAEDRKVFLELTGSCPPISGDKALLRQALTNLLTNAIRHSDPGSSVCVQLSKQNELAHIVVENEGDDIPDEYLLRIFDRFYRLDQSRQRSSIESGTGLGLAIVSSIITLHSGEITVRSENRRNAFQITLPMSSTG